MRDISQSVRLTLKIKRAADHLAFVVDDIILIIRAASGFVFYLPLVAGDPLDFLFRALR